MSSSYSDREVISMDIYRIMKQLNLDEKAFIHQSNPPPYTSTPRNLSNEDDHK